MHYVAFHNVNSKTKTSLFKVLGQSPFETKEEIDKKTLASKLKSYFLSIFPMSKKDEIRNNLNRTE